MNDKVLYWGSMAFRRSGALLLIANVCLINGNRNLQVELGQRQAAINNAGNLNQLNQALVQALAQASVNNQDKEISDLLTSQGITVKPKSGAAAAASDNGDNKRNNQKGSRRICRCSACQTVKSRSPKSCLPVSLVAFVVLLTLAFQFIQVKQVRDEPASGDVAATTLEDVQRIQNQLNALAIGTGIRQ